MNNKKSPTPPRPAKRIEKDLRVGRGKIPHAAADDGPAKERAGRDIARPKNMEEALRDSERMFAKVFRDNAAAIVLTRVRDGCILDVNQKWEEIFGFSRDEVVGKTAASDFVVWKHPGDRNRAISDLERSGALHNREYEFVRKNGDAWTALMSAEVIRLHGEPVNLVSLLDITEQKRIAEENRSLARFPSENPNPVLRLSPEGAILFANEASRALLGAWKIDGDGFVPEDLRHVISGAFADRSQRTVEIGCGDRSYSLDIVPIEGAAYVNMYGRDMTEKKSAETALRRNEERFRTLFDKMTEGSALHEIVCDEKGVPVDYRFLEINLAFEQLTGLRRADIIGKLKNDVLPGDDPEWVRIYGRVALGGKPVHFENYSPALKRHYDVYAYCPAPGQFAVLFTDISEHKKKEEELHQLNRMLRAHSHGSHAMMHATNESAYLQEICRIIVEDCGHALVWIGYAEDDEEKNVRVAAHAGFEESYLETLRISWADCERGRGPTGTAIRTGIPVICRNMQTDPCFEPWRENALRRGFAASIAIPLRSAGRSFGALTIYSKGIDPFSPDEVRLLTELTDDLAYGIKTLRLRLEHARAEAALNVSLTKYQVLFDSFPFGISIADEQGNLIESNREAERLLELPKEEHHKRTVDGREWRLIRPDGTSMPEAEFASVRALREKRMVENIEMGIVRRGGDTTWINVTAAPIPLEGYGVAITYSDITERKRMEQALQETTNYLENLLNYANAPIIVWDPSFRIIRFNRAFERLTGHSADQVHGKPLDILFPNDSKDESLKLIRDTLTGKHWEVVEIPILQRGGDIRTVLWNSANILDTEGTVVATIAQGHDITERKETEARMEASLREKETLLRELYHRTKNNLNVISSLVALQGSAVKDFAVSRMFGDMQNRIRTMSLVHEKLYQSSDLSNLDIREYIGDLAGTILAGYKNSASRVALNLDIESVSFSIDTAIPCGLIINELMTNSLKYAFPEEMTGEIGISLRLLPGDEIALCYLDNGIGFPDGFDPRKANSLGLKLVNTLVKKQLLGRLEFTASQGIRAEITFKRPPSERREREP